MESSQELQHWGIKGQKWGIRRYQNEDGTLTEAGKKRYYYQNPDGSLTEEGKKDYMKAARSGKLDYKKLSDNDLNMINSRFARENTYKQNIQKYEDSLFSTKLKNAIIDRLKGNGGGGGGKGKGGGGGGFGIGKLLAMPIKAAFEDAMKTNSKGAGGGDDATDEDSKWWREKEEHGRRFVSKYVPDIKDEKSVRKAYREKDVKRKHESSDSGTRFGVDKSVGSTGYVDATRTGTDYLSKRLAESKAKKEADYIDRRREEKRRKKESAARRRELDLEERMKKSGLILGHNAFVIRRNGCSDELYHHGIKGQRWGVRRFQNDDGSLTPEGRERYGSEKDQKKLSKDIQNYWRNRKHYNKFTNWMQERKRKRLDNSPQMKAALADVRESATKVKESIVIAQKFNNDFVSGKNKEADRYVSAFKKEHPDWAERGYDDASIREATFVRYLNDHPNIKQQRSNAYDQYNADRQKHAEACKRAASSFLKDHGNDKVTGLSVWAANKESSKRVEDVFATLIESNSLFDW